MSKIIVAVESSSDIPEDLRNEYGIYVIPMHIAFGNRVKDDGSFPPREICAYYESTGNTPKTSACTPDEYKKHFENIRSKYPCAKILLISQSGVTTSSFQNAMLAKNGFMSVECVDTRNVTIGHGMVAVKTAKLLRQHPEWSLKQAAEAAKCIARQTKFMFVIDNLQFLKAGGRLTSASAFLGDLFHIHPVIEIEDGYLRSNIKLRGSVRRAVPKIFSMFIEKYSPEMDEIWVGATTGFSEELKEYALSLAAELGFKNIKWADAGSVITTHGGPNAFGMAAYCKSK